MGSWQESDHNIVVNLSQHAASVEAPRPQGDNVTNGLDRLKKQVVAMIWRDPNHTWTIADMLLIEPTGKNRWNVK